MAAYHYTKYNDQHIYYTIIDYDKRFEVSIYDNDKLLTRKSFTHGQHTLETGNFRLDFKIKVFKLSSELFIDDQRIETALLKRKDLKAKLQALNYHNEINPKPVPKEPFNFKTLIAPIVFILAGVALIFIFQNGSKLWGFPQLILMGIGYYILWDPILNKVPKHHLDGETRIKGQFVLAVVCAFATGFMKMDTQPSDAIIEKLSGTQLS